MALRAAVESATGVVVSVTLIFPPSHEPGWLQKCESIHVGYARQDYIARGRLERGVSSAGAIRAVRGVHKKSITASGRATNGDAPMVEHKD